jgi:hypothetical protein
MNYILFVYYDNTVENSENTTNEIALQIAEHMTSKEAKFMFGDKHAIFHFSSKLTLEEMAGWIDIIHETIEGFQYVILPKPRKIESNLPKDNLDHLLSLKKGKPKEVKPIKEQKIMNHFYADDEFIRIANILFNNNKEVCHLTLDELLDKINKEGISSLTEVEKQKLDEYSKSL